MSSPKSSVRKLLAAVAAISVALIGALSPLPGEAETQPEQLTIWRVFVDGPEDVEVLNSGDYDLLEGRGDGYLLVLGENATALSLRQAGLQVTRDRDLSPLTGVSRTIDADGEVTVIAADYYGGYRTVDEHYAHMASVEANYPNLAKVYDYGDSWLKVNGRANPNDLQAICLTNIQAGDCALNPNSAKPRAVIQAAIHARELQTSEVAWRLIDELTQNYGSDADITHMMDTTEIWVVPVANPDGREIVESGGNSPYLQRKNANDSLGNCSRPPSSSNQHGVDLNRNAGSFNYGGIGTTTNPCAQTYRGSGPASEPEQAALQTLFSQLWPDQKGSPATPVASNATGTFLTLHSYGNLVLLPPGEGGVTPNDTELRALGFRMSHYNGYVTGTGPEILYGTTGTTDDYTYYTLGVASFTYEISPTSGSCSGFTPAYSCIDSVLWPLNRDALLYSVKVAGSPYMTPQGPTTTSAGSAPTVDAGTPLALSAVIDDNAFGNANGSINRPSARNVTAAEYYLDVSPLQGNTNAVAMSAADGSFNQTTETAQASVPTTGLSIGEHTLFVRGRNAGGFWGPVTATSFTVTTPVDDPPVADDQSLSTNIDVPLAVTLSGSDPEGQPLSFSVAGGPSNGSLSGSAPNLTYTPNSGYVGSDSFTFTANDGTLSSAPGTIAITVIDPLAGPIFEDDFETNKGWQTNPAGTDQATTGQWARGNPQQTNSNGPKQLDQTTSGSNAMVTDGRAGNSVGTYDIDNGVTSVQSPAVALPNGVTLELSFDYYMAHTSNSSTADFFRVSVVGNNSQVVLSELGAGNDDDAAWQRATIDLSAYAGQTVRLLLEAADASNGSIVEAAIDTLSIDATPIVDNDPPVADNQSVSTAEDSSTSVVLTGSDPDDDPITFSVVGGPNNGTLSGTAPNLTYSPDADYSGSDSFSFVANDGIENSAPATVSITVTPVNDPPTASAVDASTSEDVPVSIGLVGSDPEGSTLSYSIVSGPTNGTLSGSGSSRTYTPASGFTGTDSFVYQVSDGSLSDQATVTITVTEVGGGVVFSDDFESANGWVTNPSGTDGASRGLWERSNPRATSSSGPKQLNDTTSGVNALVTDGRGGSAGRYDVDRGLTSIRSPQINLPASGNLDLSFQYYFSHRSNSSTADFLRVTVIGSSGSQVIFEELGANNDDDAVWAAFSGSLNAFSGQSVQILIEAADNSNGSLVEAAIDDLVINAG
ncbi:MAG: M14 family zinc carboxypeptidase [Acidimicrobiales bacterium]